MFTMFIHSYVQPCVSACMKLACFTLSLCLVFNLSTRIHETLIVLLLQDMCDHYWPKNTEPMYYGYLKVQVISERKSGDWIVSKFMLTMVSVCLNKNAFPSKKAVLQQARSN